MNRYPILAHRFGSSSHFLLGSLLFAVALPFASVGTAAEKTAPVIWKFDDLKNVGGQMPKLEGAPKVVRDSSGVASVQFDGKADALIFPSNPLTGFSQFTIEILFFPEVGGEFEQRFFHAQDIDLRRGLIELRLKDSEWWLDTYLKAIAGDGLALLDPAKVHPAGRWYWAALRYDGKTMSSFVNGEKELEGPLAFEPMTKGEASLGVRLNRVYWFKGLIREVRFHPVAVAPAALQRARPGN